MHVDLAEKALLTAAAVQWLRYGRQCNIVVLERAPTGWQGVPDVLGITRRRQGIEVEIKMTCQDFWQDKEKVKRGVLRPVEFWYLLPAHVAEKVMAENQGVSGILVPGIVSTISGVVQLRVLRGCQRQEGSTMAIRQLADLVRHQSGSLCSALCREVKLRQALREGAAAGPL